MTLTQSVVELRPMLNSVIETMHGLADARHHHLVLDSDDAPSAIRGDGVRI